MKKYYLHATPGRCLNIKAMDIALGVFHMTSDLLIAVLPVSIIWRLPLRSKKEMLGLSLILGVGAFAWVVACVRFAYCIMDLTSRDRTWYAGVTFLMSLLEVNTGLICGCLPALKPLITSVRDTYSERPRKQSCGPDQEAAHQDDGFTEPHHRLGTTSRLIATTLPQDRGAVARRLAEPIEDRPPTPPPKD